MSSDRIPKISRHKASGRAVVRLNGRDYYLGRYRSREATAAYDSLIARWIANDRQPLDETHGRTVNEVILAYVQFAKTYYKADGETTSEVRCLVDAFRPLKRLFGRLIANEFGPKKLKATREKMIEMGWSRSHVNHQINRIKRMFKWACSEELIEPSVTHGLSSVPGIRKGMASVKESKPVGPVPQGLVESTLAYMPASVATMVQLQFLSGSRPREICLIRTADLDMSDNECWAYRPTSHKTEHHGKARTIWFGPKAQELLRPWLREHREQFLFSPVASENARHEERKQQRTSPMTPSQKKRRRKRNPARQWGNRYTSQSYARAITRACDKADAIARRDNTTIPEDVRLVERWAPNQLRHTRATELRREHGIEAAKTILGHNQIETTQIYAEIDTAKAKAIMSKAG